jgi:hypothetical protein
MNLFASLVYVADIQTISAHASRDHRWSMLARTNELQPPIVRAAAIHGNTFGTFCSLAGVTQ